MKERQDSMTRCYDEGLLQAFLDHALPAHEHANITSHLQTCSSCSARLEELRSLAARAGMLLAAPQSAPDPVAALARFRDRERMQQSVDSSRLAAGLRRLDAHLPRRTIMQSVSRAISGRRQRLFAGMAVAVIAIGLLVLPPMRAAADQFLQLFRVQSVMFVPTNTDRLKQVATTLQANKDTLFTGKPTLINKPAAPRAVNSLAEARKTLSFAPQQPAQFPSAPASTQLAVRDRFAVQFSINVQAARQVLAMMNVNDVTIPDALGSTPIVVNMQPSLESHYHGTNYDLNLYQGVSPTVKLPDGVDLAQLGKAGLRVLGMDPAQADAVSRSIDWRSTLVFPFPTDFQDVRQVSIGNSQGLLVGSERGGANGREPQWRMYWQHGNRFYILEGRNLDEAEMLAAAESIR